MNELSPFDRKVAEDRLKRECTSTLWQELYDQMNLVAVKIRQEYGREVDLRMNDHNSMIRATVQESPGSAYRFKRLDLRLDAKSHKIVVLPTQDSMRHGVEPGGEPSTYSIESDVEKNTLHFGDSKNQALTAKRLAELLLAEKLLSMQL